MALKAYLGIASTPVFKTIGNKLEKLFVHSEVFLGDLLL